MTRTYHRLDDCPGRNLKIILIDKFPLYSQATHVSGIVNFRGHCYIIVLLVPLMNIPELCELISIEHLKTKMEGKNRPLLKALHRMSKTYTEWNRSDDLDIRDFDHSLMNVVKVLSEEVDQEYVKGELLLFKLLRPYQICIHDLCIRFDADLHNT